MAPLSSKRQKLDHDSLSVSENGDYHTNEVQPLRQSLSDEPEPTRKQIQSKLSQLTNTDESALYSGGLYKSNMFKLQVDEMLAEVRPNYEKWMAGVDQALHKLNSLIEAVQDRATLPVGCENCFVKKKI